MSSDLRVLQFVVFLLLFVTGFRALGGRLAPKMALASILFLITRWPVLVAWALGAGGVFVMMTSGAAERGISPPLWEVAALSLFCGLGFAAGVLGPAWMLFRFFAPPVPTVLNEAEPVCERLPANHMFGNEARGGELLLTDHRLAFRPHRFNVQLDTWTVPFTEIVSATPEGLRLVVVQTKTKEEILVVQNPPRIAELIEARLGSRGARSTPILDAAEVEG